ncbi:hypothetical protein N7492_001002 [Penicillium capsulatum]|uniref:Uncharacterized protein n=1 Tax=Penicillium capsulatum TaxID=69766 RepID=A0A9W9LZ16_9EURO|nr:hypothetical protein N7492_001002 [Penicillium capsulatum]KAJ6129938.1 hypothetical protein N7512_002718 [Penicillium capsulatum]
MRKPSLAEIVYTTTFPRPTASDPGSFAAHITRHLVPEVRVETNTFYGPLDCIEAQYPGLDYSFAPHRQRLSRFPWHRRLFRVFDKLHLTEEEISGLCCWEGTKSARQRYEAEEGVSVQDTTGDAIPRATLFPTPTVAIHYDFGGPEDDQDQLHETRSDDTVRASHSRSSSAFSDYRGTGFDEDLSDEEVESCGVELNHRLLAAMAARDQGADVPLDEDWEQWMKEAGECGGYGDMVHAIRSSQPLSFLPEAPTSALRHDNARLATAATLSAESYLYSTSSSLLTSSPVFPPSSTHPSGTAR